MATIKFGASQFSNPTPANWSKGIQIFTVLAATILAWIGTANFIPVGITSILQSVLGLLIAIANGLKPFLGVETKAKTVPIDDVREIETNTVNKS